MGFPSHVAIGENEYVETIGIEFDSFVVGLVIEHRPGFTFTWNEARERARFAGDHSPVVVDADAARLVGGGEASISEAWLIVALSAATTRAFGRVVANLAWENVAFPFPVRDGQTIFAESQILDKRPSSSRPEQGILHVRTRGIVRGGREVCRYERKLLVYRSARGPHIHAGYV
ncbi:MAG: transcription regulatory protein [Alphaproteobacteria bacterium]|nr:MAG: transcription regulatory protein [Alphaproteobacteria bacterium]